MNAEIPKDEVQCTVLTPKPKWPPVGTYPGKLSGYRVVFSATDGESYQLDQKVKGVRGMNCPCTVTITETGARIEL